MQLKGLFALFRLRPVLAWGISGTALGLGTAITEGGCDLNYFYLILSVLMVLTIQGWLSHSINDLIDENVDRKAAIDKTGRIKVLISGIMSRRDLMIISMVALCTVVIIIAYLVAQLGWIVLLLASFGLYAPIAYSVPPLKLGYRPFAEFTIVLPTLITLVVGINFVASGSLSWLAFFTGVILALSNIVWFMFSRAQDADADAKFGKITTIVLFGQRRTRLISSIYNSMLLVISVILGYLVNPILLIGTCIGIGYHFMFKGINFFDSVSLSVARAKSIYMVTAFSLLMSGLFAASTIHP